MGAFFSLPVSLTELRGLSCLSEKTSQNSPQQYHTVIESSRARVTVMEGGLSKSLVDFLEHIANAASGQNQLWIANVVFQFGAKTADMDINHSGINPMIRWVRPNVL